MRKFFAQNIKKTPTVQVLTGSQTSASSPFLVKSSKEYSSATAAWKAFNGVDESYYGWLAADNATGVLNEWWAIDFGTVKNLSYTETTNFVYGSGNLTMFDGIRILGSNSATDWASPATTTGTWTELFYKTNDNIYSGNGWCRWEHTAFGSYRYFVLRLTKSTSSRGGNVTTNLYNGGTSSGTVNSDIGITEVRFGEIV